MQAASGSPPGGKRGASGSPSRGTQRASESPPRGPQAASGSPPGGTRAAAGSPPRGTQAASGSPRSGTRVAAESPPRAVKAVSGSPAAWAQGTTGSTARDALGERPDRSSPRARPGGGSPPDQPSERARHGADIAPPSDPAEPAATYWRRRFVILAIGLAVLAAGSLTLSQALRASPHGPRHSAGRSSSGHDGARGGTTAAGPGTGHSLLPSSGTSTGPASAHPSPHSPAASHKPSPRPSPKTSGFGGFKPVFCSWHSIVISLSAAQASFGAGQEPGFSLSVVSTQKKACSFNIGPSHLALLIKEGPTRIWSSADCVSGSGNLIVALHRGVPTVVTIDWPRKTSSPGCSGPSRSVPTGTYTGYAVDGSLLSAAVPIRLR